MIIGQYHLQTSSPSHFYQLNKTLAKIELCHPVWVGWGRGSRGMDFRWGWKSIINWTVSELALWLWHSNFLCSVWCILFWLFRGRVPERGTYAFYSLKWKVCFVMFCFWQWTQKYFGWFPLMLGDKSEIHHQIIFHLQVICPHSLLTENAVIFYICPPTYILGERGNYFIPFF